MDQITPSPLVVGSHRGEELADSAEMLEHLLTLRDSRGGGLYWLADATQSHPCLAMCFSEDLAHVIWFPEDGHAGFRCLRGADSPLIEEEFMNFIWDGCDPSWGEEVPSEFVLSHSRALQIARQFFSSQVLPEGCEWFEL